MDRPNFLIIMSDQHHPDYWQGTNDMNQFTPPF
jgi:hypothetical protein